MRESDFGSAAHAATDTDLGHHRRSLSFELRHNMSSSCSVGSIDPVRVAIRRGLESRRRSRMLMETPRLGGSVASKDKGGKTEKKQPKKTLKEKRASKKQKKAK